MEGGEHWFHTPDQMHFLDDWILTNKVRVKLTSRYILNKMVGSCISRETGREIGVVLLVGIDERLAPTIKIKTIVTAMWQD